MFRLPVITAFGVFTIEIMNDAGKFDDVESRCASRCSGSSLSTVVSDRAGMDE
ncbi:MAG: hypothetical protein AB2L13_10360 [Spirochaetota bacterium]